MITLLWTKSGAPVSKWIRSLTGESCSHFAIVLDGRYVFHSNFYGSHLKWRSTFERHNTVVYRLDIPAGTDVEEKVYQRLLTTDERPYDFGALLFFAYGLIMHRLFGYQLPTHNLWGRRDAMMCVEIAACLEPLGLSLPTLDIVLPGRLYYFLKEQVTK